MEQEEFEKFVKETRAVAKMLHYLPIDILEAHVFEIITEVRKIEPYSKTERLVGLVEETLLLKEKFEQEIKLRNRC